MSASRTLSVEDIAIQLFNSKSWCDADENSIRGLSDHIPLLVRAIEQAISQERAAREEAESLTRALVQLLSITVLSLSA